jgi:hypothetical protein
VVAVDTVYAIRAWRMLQPSAVKLATTGAQALGGLLWSDVALGLGHHLIADLELADSSAAQEWWVEVDVEVAGLDLIGCACERSLMETHAWNCC